MTHDQIDRMVRQANPVPDMTLLEPFDASVLVFDQQRGRGMQTDDRAQVTGVREKPTQEKPRRGLLIGMAAAAAIIIGVVALFLPGRDGPVADQTPTVTEAPLIPDPAAVDVATGFMEAYAAFDVDRAVTYVAADVSLADLGGDLEGWRRDNSFSEATGFKVLPGACEVGDVSPSGTRVRCPYDYHALRSEEIGLGPFGGSWYDFTVHDGTIVSVRGQFEYMANGFSAQVWEPFAAWVAETHPDDAAILYADWPNQSMQATTDAAIPLWEQRTQEYVETVNAAAVDVATGFMEAYAALDVDRALTYVAADVNLADVGGDLQGWRRDDSFSEATGFKVLPGACEVGDVSPAGTRVRCPYDYHALRSEEIGLGPFGGNWYLFTVQDGKIVSVRGQFEYMANGFSAQVWEPFAAWVAETHPDDVLALYADRSQSLELRTEEAIPLWEQRTREYVEVVNAG